MKRQPNNAAEQEAAAPAEVDAAWSETLWSGLSNFECTRCPYATLEREQIVNHVSTVHGVAVPSPVQE